MGAVHVGFNPLALSLLLPPPFTASPLTLSVPPSSEPLPIISLPLSRPRLHLSFSQSFSLLPSLSLSISLLSLQWRPKDDMSEWRLVNLHAPKYLGLSTLKWLGPTQLYVKLCRWRHWQAHEGATTERRSNTILQSLSRPILGPNSFISTPCLRWYHPLPMKVPGLLAHIFVQK